MKIMSRSSVSITPPNEKWIKSQIDNEEFINKSDVLNDLIRKARSRQDDNEIIRAKLIEGERSDMSERTPDDIMKSVIKKKKLNGEI